MSVYFIASYEITDSGSYANYVPGVLPIVMKYGCEVLAADYASNVLEGAGTPVNVILRFPSEDAAMGWYNDPEYQPFKKLRLDSTNGTAVLLQEFVPPAG